jgi:hypothetical protein
MAVFLSKNSNTTPILLGTVIKKQYSRKQYWRTVNNTDDDDDINHSNAKTDSSVQQIHTDDDAEHMFVRVIVK